MKPLKPILVASLLWGSISVYAQDNNIEAMAADLIQLRGEVEELQAKLDNKKETHKNRMSSLAVQRTDLESQLQRNSMEFKQLINNLADAQKRASKDTIEGKDLKPS